MTVEILQDDPELDELVRRSQKVVRTLIFLLISAGAIAFAWFGLMKALENMAIGQTADVSDIVTWPVYFLVPIVFVLLAALYVLDALVIARTGETETDLATGEPPEHDIEYRADRSSANGHNL